MPYRDVEVEVERTGPARGSVHVLDAPAPHRPPFATKLPEVGDLIGFLGVVDALTKQPEQKAPGGSRLTGRQYLQRLGLELFDSTLGAWGEFSEAQLVAKQAGAGLRVRLRANDSGTASLPWELLFDKQQGDYLALNPRTSITRNSAWGATPEPLSITPPLRVLVCAASPIDLTPLNVDLELQAISVAASESEGLLELVHIPGRFESLCEALKTDDWHVFHFIGHGDFQGGVGGALAFEKADRTRDLIDATTVARELGQHDQLRLAVLNACRGAMTAERVTLPATADSIVRRGTPAVVAMQFYISDTAAVTFAGAFYAALSRSGDVETAAQIARQSIAMLQIHTAPTAPATEALRSMEWCAPVLYLNSDDGRLFALPEKSAAATGPVRERGLVHSRAPVAVAQPLSRPRSLWRERRWLVLGAALLLVVGAAVAAAIIVFSGGSGNAEVERYVRQLDSLLANSARTRGDLGGLISDVQRRSISRQSALDRINQIIGERKSLRESLPVDQPDSFRHAQSSLRSSVDASIEDDQAVESWIEAFFDRSPAAASRFAEVRRLSFAASARKSEFLSEYNQLRQQKLGLAPLNVSY